MDITPLPAPPRRSDPANFSDRADAFLGALPLFATQANELLAAAQAAALTAVNAPGTSATSTTALAIGMGAKDLTIQAGKAFTIGQFVILASTAGPGNYMVGQITAYDGASGALSISAGSVNGSGTFSDWAIALTAAPMTAGDILAKLKTVDGEDSGLDADLLDGEHGSYYMPKSGGEFTGGVAVGGNLRTTGGVGAFSLEDRSDPDIDWTLYHSGGTLHFHKGGVDYVTVDALGRVTTKGILDGQTPDNTTTGALRVRANATPGHAIIQFTDAPVNAQWGYMRVDAAGELYWSGSILSQGNISYASDRRFKENIRPLEGNGVAVLGLEAKRYIKDGREQVGFIAQDVEVVMPAAVITGQGEEGFKSLDLAPIVAELVERVKFLDGEVGRLMASA